MSNDPDRDEPLELVASYTRAQAIDDGTLVDVSVTAAEAGFRFPVALTAAVYAQYVEVPRGVTGQDLSGRLWDILWMLLCRIRSGGASHQSRVRFELFVRNSDRRPAELVQLDAVCGPGDALEPVLTVMLPGED